jgi:hypothetical protein
MNGRPDYILMAFILFCMIQAVKVSDLIFTKKQKKVIQDKFEKFTFYLDDLRPQEFFKKIFIEKLWRALAALIMYSIVILSAFNFFPEIDVTYYNDFLIGILGLLIGYSVFLALVESGFKVYGFDLIAWLSKGSFRSFLGRYFLTLIAGLVIPGLVYLIMELLSPFVNKYLLLDGLLFLIFLCCAVILFCIIPTLVVIGIFGVVVISIRIVTLLTLLIIYLLKGICWRIVEYNNGAVAALTLIITFVLGILEAYIKFGHTSR